MFSDENAAVSSKKYAGPPADQGVLPRSSRRRGPSVISRFLGRSRAVALDLSPHFMPLGPLLMRVSLGALFLQSGMGKLAHLERTAAFFAELGIIAPAFHAVFVGALETLGGAALAIGFATRLFSLPLAATMIVAVLTAKLSEVEGLLSLFALLEVTVLSALVWLLVQGPGRWSLDARFSRGRAFSGARPRAEQG